MLKQELLNLERDFWLGGAEVYERSLAIESVMVFPHPVGVLDRNATIDAIANAARWKSVSIKASRFVTPSADVAVLVYEAEADRGEGVPYRAQCSSTYVKVGGMWKLALHQQTPVSSDE